MNQNSPIFIIGNPRSGTTLLRLLLTSHRDIVIPPEAAFLVWLYDKYKNWSAKHTRSHLRQYLKDLLSSKKFETWKLDKEGLRKHILTHKPDSYSSLSFLVYEYYALSNGNNAKRWGDKNNWYLNHVSTINKLYSDTYFIHIVRDGRDVAASYKKLIKMNIKHKYAPKLPDKIEIIASEWKTNLEKINNSLKSLDHNKVLEIRYEDLVVEPEGVLEVICNTLHLPYDPNMVKFYLYNKKTSLEPRSYYPWKKNTYNCINKNAIGRYKKTLTTKDVKVFEDLARDMLAKYIYI